MSIQAFLKNGSIITTQPGRLLLGWGERVWQKSAACQAAPSFYFPDFFLNAHQPWFVHAHHLECSVEEFIQKLKRTLVSSRLLKRRWDVVGKELFQQAFVDLQMQFSQGSLQKAVPFVFDEAEEPMSSFELQQSLINILHYTEKYPLSLYGFWGESEGILGATPELLFRWNQREKESRLNTMACAGTCSKDQADQMMKDSKLLYEHDLVIQGITQSLSVFGKVKVGLMQKLLLPTLCHLVSPITIKFYKMESFDTIVRALHPTPALGAFPKEEGMHWLNDYQLKLDRQRFGAPVGYSMSGKSCCYVAIRNVQWSQNKMKIGAGCGVVSKSILESEWSEILLKIRSIKKLLAL